MLEITIRRYPETGGPATSQAFQFENDALQAFLTESPDAVLAVTELRALGTTIVAEGSGFKERVAKTAGPGAPRTPTAAKPVTPEKK